MSPWLIQALQDVAGLILMFTLVALFCAAAIYFQRRIPVSNTIKFSKQTDLPKEFRITLERTIGFSDLFCLVEEIYYNLEEAIEDWGDVIESVDDPEISRLPFGSSAGRVHRILDRIAYEEALGEWEEDYENNYDEPDEPEPQQSEFTADVTFPILAKAIERYISKLDFENAITNFLIVNQGSLDAGTVNEIVQIAALNEVRY